jgi:aldose 1-epimerase
VIAIQRGRVALLVDERRGGRLSSFEVDGRELLIGAPDDRDRSIRWGCFLMAPWAGRIENGILDWDGVRHRLPLTDGRHALHGLVFDRPWQVEGATATEAVLSCRIGPPNWPVEAIARERFVLADEHLEASAELVAEGPMPAAIGWHPWFRRDGDTRIRLEASETLETHALIPTGRRLPVDALTDLRGGPAIGSRSLDHVYPDPRPPAILHWPTFGLQVDWEGPVRAVVVHTTPTSFCIEPQTGWPNAPALAAGGIEETGLVRLQPGGTLGATMRWRWQLTESY